MKEPEMVRIADFIAKALRKRNDESALAGIKGDVAELCAAFPAYPNGV
jgi:glycine/serine hydroxymethyltransferase